MNILSMKSTKYICIILITFVFNITPSQAQIQISPDLFTKVWQVDFDEDRFIKNMSEDEWNSFKQLSTSQRHRLVSSMKTEATSTTFEFKLDQHFIVRKSGEVLEEGKWELQADGKTIIAKNDKGFEDIIELVEVNKEKMVLNSKEYGQELVLIPLDE